MPHAPQDETERLALAIEAASLGTFDFDAASGLIHWSARMCDIHGIAPCGPMPIERLDAFLLPEDRAAVHDAAARALDPAGDGHFSLEHRIVRPDGTHGWVNPRGRAQFATDAAGVRRATRLIGVTQDITERRRIEQALRDSEERFRLAAESAALGSFEFDPLAVQWRWSASVADFYGFKGEQPLSTEQAFERVHPDDRDRIQALLAQMLAPDGQTDYPYQHRVVRPDGRVRCLDIRARVQFEPGPAGAPRAVRVTGVVWDVTQHEELVETLRQADRAKDEFLAMLAHELRNPLAPLVNALRLLERSASLDGADRAALSMAIRQAAQLRRLVDDLLEVSRITRGRIALRCEPMRMDHAVRDAAESVAALVQARGQTLEVTVPAQPVDIVADPARIAQVLENLLANAVKYTPEGGRIRLELAEAQAAPADAAEPQPAADAGAPAIRITVADDGVGIEPEKIGRIFELFTQVDATLDRAQGGLGIGLALVRRLVELHGGDVSAHSAGRNRGTTFTVRLPRTPPMPASGSPPAPPSGSLPASA